MKRLIRFLILFFGLTAMMAAILFVVLPLPGQIPVLMYHYVVPKERVGPTSLDVSVEEFERQMCFLRKFGFSTISMDQLYAIKMGHEKAKGKQIAVTFDDGNETYWQFALPILERHQIPSVNFLIWDNVKGKKHGSMDLKKAKELASNPLVTLGSHTVDHFFLSDLDSDKARREIFKSKRNLEKALKRKVDYFCYPGGVFSQRDVELVRAAGYRMAFTTSFRKLRGNPETIHTLARLKVSPNDGLFIFWLRVSGLATMGEKIRSQFLQLTAKAMNDTLKHSG